MPRASLAALLLVATLTLLLTPATSRTNAAPPASVGRAAPQAHADLKIEPTAPFVCAPAAAGRGAVAAAGLTTFLPLVAGGQGSAGNSPTLLASYVFRGDPDYLVSFQEFGVAYRPRQFRAGLPLDTGDRAATVDSPGPYDGWDVLNTPNGGVSTIEARDDWLRMRLSRAATLAVVWRAGEPRPNWLSGWQPGGTVTIEGQAYPSYRRAFPAGIAELGSVYNPGERGGSRATYLVLFGESDGSPCAAPTPPAGRALPDANAPCPAWVHDSYVTTGPDGKSYPTWHPQIDPVYWCYFDHEHGSDPALFSAGYSPAYGYISTLAGVVEPHSGFKSYVFDDGKGHMWLLTHHFGTGGLRRACVRFHGLDIAVADKASGELLADLHLMGDFGKSVAASADSSDVALTPPACPDQAAQPDADGSNGIRKIHVANRDLTGYEPWRLDDGGNVLGLNASSLTFATRNPQVVCNTLACDTPHSTGHGGESRFLTVESRFRLQAGANSGVFYTDPSGTQVLGAAAPGAVRQLIKPGLSLALDNLAGHGFQSEPWQMLYVFSERQAANEAMLLEGAVTGAN